MNSIELEDFNRIALTQLMVAKMELGSSLFSSEATESVLPDGSKITTDKDGQVIYAEYCSGAAVRRHISYTIARGPDGGNWFINRRGHLMSID